jgi:hypothetical protein
MACAAITQAAASDDDLIAQYALYSCNAAVNLDTTGQPLTFKRALAGPDRKHWLQAQVEEWERLGPEGTKTIRFGKPKDKPTHRMSSYLSTAIRVKVQGLTREFRVRNTFGGDRSDYNGPTKADAGDIETFKALLNAVVSDPNSRMMTLDIKDFYLNELLDEPEYMMVNLREIPAVIIERHGLRALANDRGMVLIIVDKTIYGLKQSGMICRKALVAHLALHGYHADPLVPTVFAHETRATGFVLVVDDFGVKYNALSADDAQHLIDALRTKYTVKVDMEAKKFIGVTLDWHLEPGQVRSVTLSMPGYVAKALERFQVVKGPRVDNPMPFTPTKYKRGPQHAHASDESPPGTAADTLLLQQIVGVFLYLARCVDGLATIAVNKLSSAQSTPTVAVMSHSDLLLQYFASHSNPSITYTASDMHLFVHTDASFAGESGARSRIGAVYMLGNKPAPGARPQPRHPLLVTSVILPTVAANVAEAEYGGAFHAAQRAVPLRNILNAIRCPQPTTDVITDNAVAHGIATDTIKQKRSRSVDIHFHWLRDQVRLGRFAVHWEEGTKNLADFQTKSMSTKDFQEGVPFYQNVSSYTAQ